MIGREVNPGPLETIYLGGGTPTLLGVELVERLISSCCRTFGVTESAEISLEANPGTISAVELKRLRAAGVNRLSLGIQSWHDEELHLLGRIHTAKQSMEAIEAVRTAGFDRLSIDLMNGIPGQTLDMWERSLELSLAIEPEHLSVYQLSVDNGTELFTMVHNDQVRLPPEEMIDEMDAVTELRCRDGGLVRYELANYSRPGFPCAHNMVYWHNDPYFACGAGAVSYIDGERCRRLAEPLQYCRAIEGGGQIYSECERLDRQASYRESVVLGLRLIEGVELSRLHKRYGLTVDEVYDTKVPALVASGMLELTAGAMRLTARGRRYANQVMADLV